MITSTGATAPGEPSGFLASQYLVECVNRALAWWRVRLDPAAPAPSAWAWKVGPAFDPNRAGYTAELPACVPDALEGAP